MKVMTRIDIDGFAHKRIAKLPRLPGAGTGVQPQSQPFQGSSRIFRNFGI